MPASSTTMPKLVRQSPMWCISALAEQIRAGVDAAIERAQIPALSLRGVWALECIAAANGTSQSNLADMLDIDRSDMVRLLDQLQEADLVARNRDPKDRRRQLISLTEQGATSLRSIRRAMHRAERVAVDSFPAQQRAVVAGILGLPSTATDAETTADTDSEAPAKQKVDKSSKSPKPQKAKSSKAKIAEPIDPDAPGPGAEEPVDGNVEKQTAAGPDKKSKKKRKKKKKKGK